MTDEKEQNNEQFQRLLQSIAINAPKGSKCPPPNFAIKLSPVKKSPKKSPTKRSPKKSPTKRSPIKIVSAGGTCKDYKITELRQMAVQQNIKGRSTMNKQQLCEALDNVKTCKNYKVTELRILAKDAGITSYYKMNKKELCDVLKI